MLVADGEDEREEERERDGGRGEVVDGRGGVDGEGDEEKELLVTAGGAVSEQRFCNECVEVW